MEARVGLKNRRAIITGGAGGIGKAAADALLDVGCCVVLVDFNEAALAEALEELQERHGAGNIVSVVADVTKEEDNRKFVDVCVETFGGVDIAFLNAGTGPRETKPITESDLDELERLWKVNVVGVFAGLKHCMKAMEASGGSIICTASALALKGNAMNGPYGCSKAAVINLVQCAAVEGAANKIRVNGIIPGTTKTNMLYGTLERLKPDDMTTEQYEQVWKDKIPLNRFGECAEIANMVLFLAGAMSTYTTGHILVADGGRTCHG